MTPNFDGAIYHLRDTNAETTLSYHDFPYGRIDGAISTAQGGECENHLTGCPSQHAFSREREPRLHRCTQRVRPRWPLSRKS